MAGQTSNQDRADSGVTVYPKLGVPKRDSAPRMDPSPRPGGGGRLAAVLVVGALVGGALGFVARPSLAPDGRIAQLQATATEARDAALELENRLKIATAAKAAVDEELELAKKTQRELAVSAARAKMAAADNANVQSKLTSAIDKGTGTVSTEGDEIRLQLVDKVLFEIGEAELTTRGKAVLAKVATALADLPDKQIWVQGHTDDHPIGTPPRRRGRARPPRFASNWELSAARALTVVHYLQDVAKLDPTRLAALAFGQYRPVSRSNKAANRRIEIVLYPHRATIERQ